MKKTWMLAALWALSAPAFAFAGELDGTQWQLDEKGALFWGSDSLLFSNDRFRSQEAAEDGYAPAPYSANKSEDRVTWEAAQTNDKGEQMQWSGTANGDRMDGTVTRVSPGGETTTKQWRAMLKGPEY